MLAVSTTCQIKRQSVILTSNVSQTFQNFEYRDKMNTNPIVLSYEESLLRQSDVALLHGPHWLNDNIISFYFEYLKNTLKEAPHILFVGPEVTQCIKIIPPSQIKVFLEPLEADEKEFIFFALNDNEGAQVAGGTHWSLLLFSRNEDVMYHYDSSRGSNRDQAENFSHKLFSYFGVKGEFKEEMAAQQTNGYDCGIYLICNAEHLTKFLIKNNSAEDYCNNKNQDVKNSVGLMRKQVANIIEKLRS